MFNHWRHLVKRSAATGFWLFGATCILALLLSATASAGQFCNPKVQDKPEDHPCPAVQEGFPLKKAESDSFDKAPMKDRWCLEKMVEGSLRYNTYAPAEGKGAIFITIKRGDRAENGQTYADQTYDDCSERDEITERSRPAIRQNVTYEFSLFIPTDLPVIDRRLVLAQIKQGGKKGKMIGTLEEKHANPVFSFRLVQIPDSDELCFFTKTGSSYKPTDGAVLGIVSLKRSEAAGHWHRIIMHYLVDPYEKVSDPIKDKKNLNANRSQADWWFDGNKVDRIIQGPVPIGYAVADFGASTYFKMGPYRDQAESKPEDDKPWIFGYDRFLRSPEIPTSEMKAPVPPEVTAACKKDQQQRPHAWE
jgi:hypothetical protein